MAANARQTSDMKPHPPSSYATESVHNPPQSTSLESTPDRSFIVTQKLKAVVRSVQDKYPGQVGIVITNPRHSDSKAIASAGPLQEGPAWSTSKVPVAIAAVRDNGVTDEMRLAITASDNEAADKVWRSLGSPEQAGAAATKTLREGGDNTTTIQTTVTRPGFSSFGQTRWTLANQAIFGANLQCIPGGPAVSTLMGHIISEQSYGLGAIPGAHYKGGWGPDERGAYFTRQFGFIPGEKPGTFLGVAIAAQPSDGSYETSQAMLTELAKSLPQLHGFGGTC